MNPNKEIATTILSQISTIDSRAIWAWGAKNLTVVENGLRFKSSGMVKNKGFVKITLNGNDLYDVEFGRIRKSIYKTVKLNEDVFVDDLVDIIDSMVG